MTFEGCNVECQDPKEMHGAQGPRGALGPRAAKSQPGVSGSNEAGLEAHKEINQGLGLYGGRQVRGVASTLRLPLLGQWLVAGGGCSTGDQLLGVGVHSISQLGSLLGRAWQQHTLLGWLWQGQALIPHMGPRQ